MIRILILIILAVSVAVAIAPSSAAPKKVTITVSAGEYDRQDTVISFDVPATLKGSNYELRDSGGQMVPLQIDSNRQATFVLRSLKAGASASFTIVSRSKNGSSSVQLNIRENGIDVTLKGRKVFSFVGKPAGLPEPNIKPVFLRGGYIHPVYTPTGRIVTDDYPSDHYHHHGIWFAWTKTQFNGGHPDFWNVDDLTGRVDFVEARAVASGSVFGELTSKQNYVALKGTDAELALNELWDVRVYDVGQSSRRNYFLFDITATQTTSGTLKLDEYRYGGMGIRGHRDWKDKTKVSFLTSEGKTRANGNATRGGWFAMYGPVDGADVSIAVLDSPQNFRSPQPMRLNPDDPFFNYAPSQLGPFEIKPGEPFVLRYRYVVSDGKPDASELNRLWNDYATPPKVSIAIK